MLLILHAADYERIAKRILASKVRDFLKYSMLHLASFMRESGVINVRFTIIAFT